MVRTSSNRSIPYEFHLHHRQRVRKPASYFSVVMAFPVTILDPRHTLVQAVFKVPQN